MGKCTLYDCKQPSWNHISFYSYSVAEERRFKRSVATDQQDFYALLENLLTNTFAMDGKVCVQRIICDLAAKPIKERSLMGEVLHRLFE